MDWMTISDELRDELVRDYRQVIELYDKTGARIGTGYIALPEPTLEELKAISASAKGWVSAEAVMERLRSLTKCE